MLQVGEGGTQGGLLALWAVKTHPPVVEVSPSPLGAVLPLQAVSSSCSITTRGAASTGYGLWARGITWTSRWVSSQPGVWRDEYWPFPLAHMLPQLPTLGAHASKNITRAITCKARAAGLYPSCFS